MVNMIKGRSCFRGIMEADRLLLETLDLIKEKNADD